MLINRTHFSVRQAISKPHELVQRAKELGQDYCGICDIDTLAGSVEFVEACHKAEIKPIIGMTIQDRHFFAKNLDGWKLLIKMASDNTILSSDSLWEYDLDFVESRYVNESDEDLYKIIRAMYHKTTVSKLTEPTSDLYFKKISFDHSEFDNYTIFRSPLLPKFGDDEVAQLKAIVDKNFDRLCPTGKEEIYRDRIEKEFKVISLNNLAGYFLIVEDFIRYARSIGALVGPGRGCFLPDTRVKVSKDIFIPICMIEIGDTVIDAYGNAQLVFDTMEYDINEDIIEIEFENNVVIRCTKDHKFLTKNRGFVEAVDLNDDDDIVEV